MLKRKYKKPKIEKKNWIVGKKSGNRREVEKRLKRV